MKKLERYSLANWEVSGTDIYLGYIDDQGSWYVTKVDTTAGTLRYAFGDTDFATNWTGRAGLAYQLLYLEI